MLLVQNKSKAAIIIHVPTGYTGPQPFYAADRSTKSMQINSGQVAQLADVFAKSRVAVAAIEAGELEVLKTFDSPLDSHSEVRADG